MARPKKAAGYDMLRILNSYWEAHGDPHKLKCSLLEEYAASIGFDIKAYDFRRDESVRKRISELQTAGTVGFGALAYKNLDIDRFIAENATKMALKAALAELDAYWRDIYGHAAQNANENAKLLSDNAELRKTVAEITGERDAAAQDLSKLSSEKNALVIENRYLRVNLTRYLYPAVANEILYREGVLKQTDTQVTDIAMDELVETSTPLTLTAAVATDVQALSREQALLERMKHLISDGG